MLPVPRSQYVFSVFLNFVFFSFLNKQAHRQLSATLVTKPNNVLYSLDADDTADSEGLKLTQLQNLKKQIGGGHAACREDIGKLTNFVSKHTAGPTNPREGYFCVHDVRRNEEGKPHVTMVATTTKLQQRATTNPAGTSAIDGGHGFCIFGWPLHIKGEINARGQLAATELMITSTMAMPHVREAIHKAISSAETITQRPGKKSFTMFDAEQTYIQTMQEGHGSRPLMCFFHVVKAVRDYMCSHAQVPLAMRAKLFLSKVLPDLWSMPHPPGPTQPRPQPPGPTQPNSGAESGEG